MNNMEMIVMEELKLKYEIAKDLYKEGIDRMLTDMINEKEIGA